MLSHAYIGFILKDYRNGGYVSHRDTEGDGGGGTSPPCTEGKFIENRDLIYIFVRYFIARLRPEQRFKRGTASQFLAQRENPE